MKPITFFMFNECPHCQLALKQMQVLFEEDPKYKELEIKQINEREEPELADTYDYYYVPTYYVGDEKVHEGHAEYEDVKKVFDLALEG